MERKKVIIFISVAFIGLWIVFLPGFSELQKLREKNEQLLSRIKLLEEHNSKLDDELLRIEQDPDYLEERAREKLGIIKKGEYIYKKQAASGHEQNRVR